MIKIIKPSAKSLKFLNLLYDMGNIYYFINIQ